MADMEINGIRVERTFAEAFEMKATRIIITALNAEWALHAARTMTGFATSIIACECEAGVARELSPEETPDGRPGAVVLMFAVSGKALTKQLQRRVGQCVLTTPTTACYSGIDGDKTVDLGKNLRFFGDGYQISKLIGGRRYWRIPVMDGEFICEESAGRVNAIGGGNFLIAGRSVEAVAPAAAAAAAAMRTHPDVILPFPGGVVRSGSKITAKYPGVPASTNDAWCPTLRGLTPTELQPEERAVLEIVVDGLTTDAIAAAMRDGIHAACGGGPDTGLTRITAGNYGGELGQYQFHLEEVLA